MKYTLRRRSIKRRMMTRRNMSRRNMSRRNMSRRNMSRRNRKLWFIQIVHFILLRLERNLNINVILIIN